jgi:hypothetical protein
MLRTPILPAVEPLYLLVEIVAGYEADGSK